MKHTIGILGEGAWATAIAHLLATNGHTIYMWCHDAKVADALVKTGSNNYYLPGVILPKNVHITTSMQECMNTCTIIYEAVPIKFLRDVLMQARSYYNIDQLWVMLSKGIEQRTLLLPTEIIDDVMQSTVHTVVLSGPSFAHELSRQQPTGVMLACHNNKYAQLIKNISENDYFKTTLTSDVKGVQLCAAYKNIIALAAGYIDGLGYAYNTTALLITRGLHEMSLLMKLYGGTQETPYNLAGIGDLIVTATGSISKNRTIGTRLGSGDSLEDIINSIGCMPEGINTLKSIIDFTVQRKNLFPLCTTLYDIIFHNKKADSLIVLLLTSF